MTIPPDHAAREAAVPFNPYLAPGLLGYFKYPARIQGAIHETIRDPAAWAELWYRITPHPSKIVEPYSPAPDIDFAHEMLLVVGFGMQVDGNTTELTSVVRRGDELIVKYRRGWNQAESVTDSFNWPLVVVRIPRDDTRRVVFEELPTMRS